MRFLALPPASAWLLLAATAALVVLFYLLKPSPRRLVVASGLIWQRVLKERKREPERLRWWLSLLLALAIALALAAALTQPEVAALTGAAEDHLVVIDNAHSMAARTADGRSRLQHAIERGEQIVRGAGAGSRFLVADTMRQLPAAGFDGAEEALDRLRAVTVHAGGTPWFPAVGQADVQPARGAVRDGPAREEVTAGGKPRRTWFVTDGIAGVEVPRGAEIVSVFQSAPNVGITAFEARPVPSDPRRHEVYVEVENAAPGQVQVELQIVGVGGAPPVTRTLRIAGNAAARIVEDVAAFEEGPLRATVRADHDAFDLDDTAYAYLPGKARLRVALVTAGNADLSRLLRLLPRLDLQVLSPARLRELARFDAVILDRVAPPRAPLVPALLIGPGRVPWLTAGVEQVTATHIARWDESHPLLAGVSLRDVLIDRATTVQAAAGAALPLATVARGPADEPLILATRDGRRVALVSFALDASNFALQPGFPEFLANAVDWLTREPRALARTVGAVSLPLSDARVLDLEGRAVETRAAPDGTVFDADTPGLYTAVAGDQRLRVTVNLLDPRVTAINSGRHVEATPPAQGHGRALAVDSWWLLLCVAGALLVAEWWSYTRRLTV